MVKTARAPRWLDTAARVLLAASIALIAVPIRYHVTTPDLDPSAAFALNWAAAHGVVHGRDVAFTYGPLGYLALPMAVGSNLARGMLFQLAFWLLFAGTVAWIALARRVPLYRLAIFAVLLACAAPLLEDFGSAGPDFFIGFWVVLLLGCALEGRRWTLFYAAAAATAVLLLFVKLSSGLQALSAIGLFAAGVFLADRARGLRAVAMAACVPVLFAAVYLLYCPSTAALARYVRANMEIGAGYGAAMSQGSDPAALRAALLIFAVWLGFAVVLWLRRQPSAALAVALLGPLFMEFKHAFSRQAGHLGMFFYFVPFAAGVVLLFTEFRRKDRWAQVMPAVAVLALWYPYGTGPRLTLTRAQSLADALHPGELHARLAAQSQAALASDRLPAALAARIGGASVTALPWEAAYAAANPLNYRVLPVFANHQAYTAFLDGWNAEALADAARAPAYVIFDWVSIDDHHPLLEVPATSLALYRDYDLDSADAVRMLLRRRSAPRFGEPRLVRTVRVRTGEPLRFESTDRPLIARIRLEPTLSGRLLRLSYRIPEVRAILSSPGGRWINARIPPDNLPGGVALNFTPANLSEARALFEGNVAVEPMDALVLAGPGLDAYHDSYTAEIYEISGVTLATAPAARLDTAALQDRGTAEGVRIELFNGRGIEDYGANEFIDVPSPGYLTVHGSAVDRARNEPAGAVWIELDGRFYPARYGLPRPEIAAVSGNPALRDCGYEWTVPAWKLGGAEHRIGVRMVSRDGAAFYSGSKSFRFRMR